MYLGGGRGGECKVYIWEEEVAADSCVGEVGVEEGEREAEVQLVGLRV